jgi:hypothetical protein
MVTASQGKVSKRTSPPPRNSIHRAVAVIHTNPHHARRLDVMQANAVTRAQATRAATFLPR